MSLAEWAEAISDKVGLTSIATTVGITTAQHAEVINTSPLWTMTDYALLISMIGGSLFAIEKIVSIYFRVRNNKKN